MARFVLTNQTKHDPTLSSFIGPVMEGLVSNDAIRLTPLSLVRNDDIPLTPWLSVCVCVRVFVFLPSVEGPPSGTNHPLGEHNSSGVAPSNVK